MRFPIPRALDAGFFERLELSFFEFIKGERGQLLFGVGVEDCHRAILLVNENYVRIAEEVRLEQQVPRDLVGDDHPARLQLEGENEAVLLDDHRGHRLPGRHELTQQHYPQGSGGDFKYLEIELIRVVQRRARRQLRPITTLGRSPQPDTLRGIDHGQDLVTPSHNPRLDGETRLVEEVGGRFLPGSTVGGPPETLSVAIRSFDVAGSNNPPTG